MRPFAPLLALMLALAPGPGKSQEALDFHVIFEARCLSCHGHAGPFARDNLQLEGDRVLRGNGRALGPFLKTHRGGLSDAELALFLDTFRNQLLSDGLYRETCLFCHDRAYVFARKALIVKDGVLTGRYSGYVIGDFLRGHARLTPQQARIMTGALEAILGGAR